jgi:hypothetical protein
LPDGVSVAGSSVAGGSAEAYLKRASRIAEDNSELPWLEGATARLALADYYIASSSMSRARRIYRDVWNELAADEGGSVAVI